MDDIKQGLVTVNADFPVGQGGHDSLQAPGTLLQEVHGQDGCRHLHCPQLLTLARNSQCVCREFRASGGKEGQREQKGREGSGLTGRWCGGVGACQRPHLVGEAMQTLLGAAHHQGLVYPDQPHRLGTQLDAILGVFGVSVE